MHKEKKTQKQTEKKQLILDAAEQLIIKKGVENTSLADISKEVGISKGTLYYYYTSKSDLIFDITERLMNVITSNLLTLVEESSEETTPAEIITVVLETLIQAKTRGRLHFYLMHEALTGNEILKEQFRLKYSEWQQMLVEGFTKVAPENKKPEYLANLIIAVIDGFILQSLLGNTDIPVQDIATLLSRQEV